MKKNWVLTIGIEKFYLTEAEKEAYLGAVNKGAKYVEFDGMVLGNNFQSLVSLQVIKTNKQLEEGYWSCENGSLHGRGEICNCTFVAQLPKPETFVSPEKIREMKSKIFNK